MYSICNTLSVLNMEHVNETATDDDDDGDTELYLFCGGNYMRDNNSEKCMQCIRCFH